MAAAGGGEEEEKIVAERGSSGGGILRASAYVDGAAHADGMGAADEQCTQCLWRGL